MRKSASGILVVATAAGLAGCAAAPALPSILGGLGGGPDGGYLHRTEVALTRANYRVVQTNLVGESRGLTLLLFLTVDPVSHTEAFADLEAKAPLEKDRARALVNVAHERNARNFLLFALPRIRVRADLVEFLDDDVSPRGPGPGDPPPADPEWLPPGAP